jgi:hypothetical protein
MERGAEGASEIRVNLPRMLVPGLRVAFAEPVFGPRVRADPRAPSGYDLVIVSAA